jgi:hypothetical protein
MGTEESSQWWQVPVGTQDATRALFEPASGAPARALYVCAHGAGGHMSDAAMLAASAQLRRRGLDVVRFNFLYREREAGPPDPMTRLKQCYAAVVHHARAARNPGRLLLGGRSMGGRVATMLAAESFACDGLVLLAYPLHPAGQADRLRDAHLAAIGVPVLCFNGTRDALCRPDLMEQALARLPAPGRWTMHWLEGADHSFRVLKASGRSGDDVLDEIGLATQAWVARAIGP